MTSLTIGVGVEAPAVTATLSMSCSHSNFNSLKSAIRYAFVCAISLDTWANLFELLLLGSPTTMSKSAWSACVATASCLTCVAKQISSCTSIWGYLTFNSSIRCLTSHCDIVVWFVTMSFWFINASGKASISSKVWTRCTMSGATPTAPSGSGCPFLPI